MSLLTRMKLLWMKLMLRDAAHRRVAPVFRPFDDLEGMGRRLSRPPLPLASPGPELQKVESQRTAREARLLELIVRSIESPW